MDAGDSEGEDGPDRLRASLLEAGPSDRFGSPVMSLGVRSSDKARVDEFYKKQPPAWQRFRDSEKLWGLQPQEPPTVSGEVTRLDKQGPVPINNR